MWFTSGALVLAMSLARVTIIRLRETPKYLVGMGKDAEVVETLQWIAKKYNRPCSLTLERMEACGITGAATGRERRGSVSANASNRFSFGEVGLHLKGLFVTKKLALSTSLIWISWLLIGLAYPLFNVFLPTYLATRGAALGGLSDSARWRNYAIANLCSIPSPILAGFMCRSRIFWGRRGTMVRTLPLASQYHSLTVHRLLAPSLRWRSSSHTRRCEVTLKTLVLPVLSAFVL